MSTAFEAADRFVEAFCAIDPLMATALGVPGHDHEWGDLGPDGVEARHDLDMRFRHEFASHLDDSHFEDRLAAKVVVGGIDERDAEYAAGDHYRDLRHLGSAFHEIRSIFDVMADDSAASWDNIIARLETIDLAFNGYRSLLAEGIRRCEVVAMRQARSVAEQARTLAGEGSAFARLPVRAAEKGFHSDRLDLAIAHAREASGEFGRWLLDEYLPHAERDDGVGAEAYGRGADRLVGTAVDPLEAYDWGWAEFERLRSELARIGESIVPGAGIESVRDHLESDPSLLAGSTEELLAFVDEVLLEAIDRLAGRHFDLPDEIRPLTTQMAPPGGPLGVYYMRPSEDFSRPGGVWYSVGDQVSFPLYQHRSTAYHEGFPGHHLQIATAMVQRDSLSRAQRVLTWYPGYGEGWAMYAEVLMGELGYLEEPDQYFGMLAKQMYRTARVIVDIGLHLGLTISDVSNVEAGERWSYENAIRFMEVNGFRTAAQAEAEVLRYLGWPGQAIAYKLGEREFLAVREATKSRVGSMFDLKSFHSMILEHGTMRLDLMASVVDELIT